MTSLTDRPDLEAGAPAAAADWRMPVLGAAAWAAALMALLTPWQVVLVSGVGLAGAAGLASRSRHRGRVGRVAAGLWACALVGSAVAAGALVRAEVVHESPVADLARESAVVTGRLQVTSDPVLREGRFSEYVVFRATVTQVTGRGRAYDVRSPVVVIADPTWQPVPLGARVEFAGRLAPTDDPSLAGLLTLRGDPGGLTAPGPAWRAAGALRQAIRDSVAGRPEAPRALVPALVDGDDARVPEALAESFRTTGLTHLLAVSGANLTIVLGFMMTLARWCGVRGRWLLLVGVGGIVAFVLLARTEPSVVRAAAMGAVGLIGMGTNGRQRGTRALGVTVVALLLLDPWLALSVGFVLSVLATAGILFLAPGWRDAMATWMPRWVAEALAVPMAAQVACTPVVAAISGQVSLVAVLANLLAGPAVGPATILGLLGGVVGLLVPPLGRVAGWLASWCAAWIIAIAEHGARLPTAAVSWGQGPVAIAVLTLLCGALLPVAPRLLRHRRTGAALAVASVLMVWVTVPRLGWPPDGWVLVMCDVGQGDGLVVHTGAHQAIVVDTGPDPVVMDRCLDGLGIEKVPLVVLTHFHADHVDGLAGVYDGRRVGEVDVTALADPPMGVHEVLGVAGGYSPVAVAPYATTRQVGTATVSYLGPVPGTTSHDSGEGDGSAPNNSSVVLLVEVSGLRLLLTGDVEPDAQEALAQAWPGLHADVLKVPHHGSRHQDLDWLLGLGARLALVSVGADNDYGHPSEEVLAPLAAAGVEVKRTDLDGDVAVISDDGELRVATAGGP